MKHYPKSKSLSIAAATFALIFGVLSFLLHERFAKVDENPTIAMGEFISSTQPMRKISFSEINSEFLDRSSNTPNSFSYPYTDLSQLYKYAVTCSNRPNIKGSLEKALVWHNFICGKIQNLPEDFFKKTPMLHPSGVSFYRLAWIKDPKLYDEKWLLENIASASLHDLHALPSSLSLAEPFLTLQQLDIKSLSRIQDSKEIIISSNLVLVLDSTRSDELAFAVYLRKDWDTYWLKRATYPTVRKSREMCQKNSNGLCFFKSDLVTYIWWLCSSCTVMAFLLLIHFWKKQSTEWQTRQRKELETKQSMIAILTHEFRTPITSMKLSVESLREHFDTLSERAQTDVLRILSDVNRLQRVVVSSEDYLRSLSKVDTTLLELKNIHISEILLELKDTYGDLIEFGVIPSELYLNAHQGWVELCLRNIIENALTHGQAPFKLSFYSDAQSFVIQMHDAGTWSSDASGELIEPFRKRPLSKGMGLGLYVTKQIMYLMDGTLKIQKSPTVISLIWSIK